MLAVMLMVMTVNVLLLFASGRLLGGGENPLRILAGALLGALFAGLSMMPGFRFLGHIWWRLCALGLWLFSRDTSKAFAVFTAASVAERHRRQ